MSARESEFSILVTATMRVLPEEEVEVRAELSRLLDLEQRAQGMVQPGADIFLHSLWEDGNDAVRAYVRKEPHDQWQEMVGRLWRV